MIPLFSASAANAGVNLESALMRVVQSNWYVLGSEVSAFEREFAAYIGTAECVSLANGTDALELALRAVGVSAGDRVVCVANAGFYGSTAIHAVGATPLYVDVEERSLNMAPAALAEALQHKPKAIIVTHLYGQLADIEALAKLARKAGVAVIEDCAQAHGATLKGRRAGSFGDVGCFSFYPTKNLARSETAARGVPRARDRTSGANASPVRLVNQISSVDAAWPKQPTRRDPGGGPSHQTPAAGRVE